MRLVWFHLLLLCAYLAVAAPLPHPSPAKNKSTGGKKEESTSQTSTTKSKSKATTSSSSTTSGNLAALFPVQHALSKWTTAPGASGALPLRDSTFAASHKSGNPAKYGKAPDGKLSLIAHYPKGSYKPSASPRGGLSIYAPGPKSVDLSTAKEATLGYSVMFPVGFKFQKGGKLPGFCESM